MRNAIIGIAIGVVIGVVIGATVVAPRLPGNQPAADAEPMDAAVVADPAPDTKPQAAPEAGEAEPTSEAAAQPQLAAAPDRPPPAGPETVTWNMASAYAASLPQIGTLAKRVEEMVARVSGGALEIRFHGPGALVEPLDMLDAVGSGAIDAAFASPGFWGDRYPALQLFGAVPFGPNAEEYLAWIYFGGGRELARALLAKRNVHIVFCGVIAPEGGGWFRREVRTVDDLRGIRMRILGLGAKVVERLGVEVMPLTEGDIFVALERGTIDAVEFSMPTIDARLGFDRMVKNYYFPGWQQPATLFALLVNMNRWQGLGPARRSQVEAVCGDNVRHGLAEGEAMQFQALKTLTERGVRIRRWPVSAQDALAQAWREVVADEIAADEDFRAVWESLSAFREGYAVWRELGH
jgi:TRAP-type mannitol/chloroaromatic compound transport system substrate-binding protein